MELLAVVVFLTALLCCNTGSPPALVPADCNDAQIEKDAGVALDLINKHRRDGYLFNLLRVADAYVQHLENASIVYLTLDVVDTGCPVLSGEHWSSCEDRMFYAATEFGQCKAVVYINQFFKHEKLYGYNCTMSPVPPQLYECKDCSGRITVLEDPENYKEEAKKLLEKYNQNSNQTHYFKLDKVLKIFLAMGSRTAYSVEFTIKKTTCLRTAVPKNASKCEVPHGRDAHVGFCKGTLIKDTKDPKEINLNSCVIYDIPYGRHPFHHHHLHHHHHHFHDDSGEHHHCNVSTHECRPPGPAHRHHHHHHPHHYHYHHHHHPPHYHHPHHHHHDFGHHHGPRHRHGCPPRHDHHDHRGPKDHHNSSEQREERPGIHPPPGAHYPPPPAGGPHHLPPVLSQHDVLQAPGANFHSRPHGRPKKPHIPGRYIHERPIIQPFPEVLSESKTCPGKPKLDPVAGLLSLYPPRSTQ